MNILIINGANLNLLGIREPNIYGAKTYHDLELFIKNLSNLYGFSYEMVQSNHEGVIIDTLHQAVTKKFEAIIINPGAYTHYSYAIYDAILAINIPTVEVHLTDPSTRESFRHKSVIAPACVATFQGQHFKSYEQSITYLKRKLTCHPIH